MNYFNLSLVYERFHTPTNTCYFHREFMGVYRYTVRSAKEYCVYYNTVNTNIGTPCMGELTGSLANHGARVSFGKFERLLLLLRRGDPRAFLGSMFLDTFAVSGRFFSNQLYFSCKIVHVINRFQSFNSITSKLTFHKSPL